MTARSFGTNFQPVIDRVRNPPLAVHVTPVGSARSTFAGKQLTENLGSDMTTCFAAESAFLFTLPQTLRVPEPPGVNEQNAEVLQLEAESFSTKSGGGTTPASRSHCHLEIV